jgi:Sec7-like guanine-nucleotide exchange factor
MIPYMLEQKVTTRKLTKDANIKYKNFMTKIEDMYAYVDGDTPAEVASKILVYSRDIQIDKIAEIIGGKEEKYKKVLNAYLNKMDYKEMDIE